ncbi:hypothetical protein O181_125351 [Austropuccinia psidii MF-1]|uniref:Uncharacterized protein n=1 Tax=Austropuccinia psidii MF-1 TaxID=1389203 RepID=A0A9Q3Q4Y7_9BASI|nr:hypothetical protein [Austropuccinia psidii MF-1]
MLMLLHHPQDMPLWRCPIYTLTHPHASAPLPLSMLTLPLCPQNILPTMAPNLCYAAYNPYAHVVPSQHASDATLIPPYAFPPLTILTTLAPHLCAPLLMPLHPHRLPSSRFHIRSIG